MDANNLYGLSMVQTLPYAEFQWANNKCLTDETVLAYNNECEYGLTLMVDLEYPKELHKLHSDFPLAPYQRSVNWNETSTLQQRILDNNEKNHQKNTKLIADFRKREEYIVDINYLKFLLESGVKVTKYHKAITYKQKKWMKPYIDLNTELRSKAKNDFEKDFYKLMNNAVYGKTMENVRKYTTTKIINRLDEVEVCRWQSNHKFKRRHIDVGNNRILDMKKESVTLNKPVYVGAQILDLSKQHMSDFHYNVMIPHFGAENVTLCYTDTDSFVYLIKTDDVYKDFKGIEGHLDTSNFKFTDPNDSRTKLQSNTNKKVLGKFKDEKAGLIITEFIGLKSKTYIIEAEERFDENSEEVELKTSSTAKGIPEKSRNGMTLDRFRSMVQNPINNEGKPDVLHTDTHRIMSKKQKMYTVQQRKKALDPYDSKRWLCEDGVTTLPYGKLE
eukprot:TRINITY_DN26813_c0_g1_i2.p1 TRINITY_DN26813_c0_g1~~TRINITY_DN26813_c0_g1_i2.p1  ORF type:complete len:465 (+),score=-66.34 TRINITY_DN26813_c0_g1_i2:65-1396(+)